MATCLERHAWQGALMAGLASYSACPCNNCGITRCKDNPHRVRNEKRANGRIIGYRNSPHGGMRFDEDDDLWKDVKPIEPEITEYIPDGTGISDAEFDRLIHEVE